MKKLIVIMFMLLVACVNTQTRNPAADSVVCQRPAERGYKYSYEMMHNADYSRWILLTNEQYKQGTEVITTIKVTYPIWP